MLHWGRDCSHSPPSLGTVLGSQKALEKCPCYSYSFLHAAASSLLHSLEEESGSSGSYVHAWPHSAQPSLAPRTRPGREPNGDSRFQKHGREMPVMPVCGAAFPLSLGGDGGARVGGAQSTSTSPLSPQLPFPGAFPRYLCWTVHVPQWPSGLYTQSPQPPAPLEKDRAQASAQSHLSAPLEGRGVDTGTPHPHVHGATLGPGLHARGRVSVGTGAIVLGLAWV